MHVALIGTRGVPAKYGGFETCAEEISTRISSKGHKVTVYCRNGNFDNSLSNYKGVRLIHLPTIKGKLTETFFHTFLSILHSLFLRPDIYLIMNAANAPLCIILKLFRKKTCINVDGLEWLRPKWKGLGSKYFKWSSKMATVFFDQIINDSKEMSKVYQNLFKRDSKVIAYGANIRKSKNPELITEWDIKEKEFYLVVGRLIPDNNADLIIDGFLKSNSKKKLVIVGDVPYKDSYASNLKKIIDQRLIFTGYIEDQNILAELYHNCYVYIHGHEFGGTNPTMIKAMAYGCAILALDTVFNQEMLQKEKFGLFFKKELLSITSQIEFCEKENSTGCGSVKLFDEDLR